jgi:tight adherence protein C
MFLDLITLGCFLAIACFVYLFTQAVLKLQRDPIRERLAAAALHHTTTGGGLFGRSLAEGLAAQLPNFDRGNQLDQELRRAGWYRATAKQEFLAMRNVLVLLALVISGSLAVMLGPEQPAKVLRAVGFGLAAVGICWSMPRLYLRTKGNQRVNRIRGALPDALDLISMCMTGGLSLTDSLTHISREIYFAHPDLAVELLIVRQQAELRSFESAFQQLSERVDAPEIVSLAALIAQGQRLGTDIVGSIRDFADSMRLKRRQLADERSSKAGVKMLFPLTMCLLPSVFIILWGPSVLELWKFLQTFKGSGINGP